MRENVTKVVLNSTAMPFRWLNTSYRCFYCYDMFETVPELKAHNLLHERQEITKAMLKYWENDVFVDISELSCTECSQNCKSLDDLVDHLASHGVNYDKDTKFCFKPFVLKEREVICGVCDSSFTLFNQLLQHATKDHKNLEDYICKTCGRSFKKQQYKMHVYNEHRKKNVNCTQCGKMFSATKLRTHMFKAHGLKVKCKMCGERFSSYYKKQQHMTTVHRARSEFKCQHCDQIFYYQSGMMRHLKEMHLKEKNAICSVCGWTTVTQSRLKDHMLRHKEVRDVSCRFCNKKFKAERHLKQHYKLSHYDEMERENDDNFGEGLEENDKCNTESDQEEFVEEFEDDDRVQVEYLEDDSWFL